MGKAVAIFSLFALVLVSSCGKHPFACFTTVPDEDSLRVNQPIMFNAACSTNGELFYWEFYDNEDSTFYDSPITMTFHDTGNVKVFLLITSGGKTSSTERVIHIKP